MENPELERMLVENLRIAKENREYLIKIDRRQRWSRNWTVLYWVIIIGAAVVGYYYASPYFKDIRDTVLSDFQEISALTDFTHTTKPAPVTIPAQNAATN